MRSAAGALQAVAVAVARNEASTIARTVAALSEIDRIGEVVVVDGASADGTPTVAAAAGATVLSVGRRGGKGGALERAIDGLPVAPVYLLVDGDVDETAAAAAALLEPVFGGTLDVCVGALPVQADGGFGLVKRVAGALIARAGSFEPREPLSGQRAVSREALLACRPLARGFGLETAMTMDAVRLGFRVGERPVRMRHRATGRDLGGFLHRGRQGLDILVAALPRVAGLR